LQPGISGVATEPWISKYETFTSKWYVLSY